MGLVLFLRFFVFVFVFVLKIFAINVAFSFRTCMQGYGDAESVGKIVRLLLLHGAELDECHTDERFNEKENVLVAKREIARYHSDRSALIQLAIGLSVLDLPVLIVTLISEYLVSINKNELSSQYPELHVNWKIARLIKRTFRELN